MVKINYYINRYTYENVLLLISLNKLLFIKIFNSYRYKKISIIDIINILMKFFNCNISTFIKYSFLIKIIINKSSNQITKIKIYKCLI